MARFHDKEKARTLRAQGKSYSEIKDLLEVSKGTLSVWLADMPLTPTQMRNVRDLNPRRIEHFRETMRRKRDASLHYAYERAKKDIGNVSNREKFIAGLHLYWGEGLKALRGRVSIANTDPSIIIAFKSWLVSLDVPAAQLRVRLHLYADMSIKNEIHYWSRALEISEKQFRKPYIKSSRLAGLTYKSGHRHGTCNLMFENVAMWEYITMALKYLREQHTRP